MSYELKIIDGSITIILTIKNTHLTVGHIQTLTELVFSLLITSKPVFQYIDRLLNLGALLMKNKFRVFNHFLN